MSKLQERTKATLLEALKNGANADAWARFDALYRDFLIRFCRARGLQQADAEDVVQIVFGRLVSALQRFEYDPQRGRFRDYLYRCARSVVSEARRCPEPTAGNVLAEAEHLSACDAELERCFEREWIGHHYRMAFQALAHSLAPRSLEVFRALLDGGDVREVAQRFELSEAAVYKIQQRVKERLSERIREQVSEEDRAQW